MHLQQAPYSAHSLSKKRYLITAIFFCMNKPVFQIMYGYGAEWTHRTASVLSSAINWVNLVQSTFYSMPYNEDHQHFTWTETP